MNRLTRKYSEKNKLKELEAKKECYERFWNTILSNAVSGKPDKEQIIMSMDMVNQIDQAIMELTHRENKVDWQVKDGRSTEKRNKHKPAP